MFPINLSQFFSPPPGAKINQPLIPIMHPFLGFPFFLPVNSPDSGVGSLNSSPSTSNAGTPQNIPCTSSTSAPRQNKRRVQFCKVCNCNITKENERSQGPRRHILQIHLKRPLYMCPHCDYTSNYDKAHINNHMARKHPDQPGEVISVDKKTYAEEEQKWFERCFSSGASDEAKQEVKEEVKEEPKQEARPPPFSIDSILSPVSRPKSNFRFAPY